MIFLKKKRLSRELKRNVTCYSQENGNNQNVQKPSKKIKDWKKMWRKNELCQK